MAQIGTGVEYALHCLLWLAAPGDRQPSSRDLADLQGVPAPFLAKLMPKLEKAGIVEAAEGIRGGYRLARPSREITVLDVVDAIEGRKPLFDCQEIRGRCALFEGRQPSWSGQGVCGIHAVMIRAEKAMRAELARSTVESIAAGVARKAPAAFQEEVGAWFADRVDARNEARLAGVRRRGRAGDDEPPP